MAGRGQTGALLRWLLLGGGRALRSLLGFSVAFAGLALAVLGVFRHPARTSTPQLLALAGLCALVLAKLFARLRPDRPTGAHKVWDDLELGTLFIASTFVVIEITGGPDGLLYPLVYALVAFLVAFHGLGHSLYFLALILGAEAAIVMFQPVPGGWRLFASHASFNILFGLLYALFLRTEVIHRQRSVSRELERRIDAINAEAQDFRLTSGLGLESRELTAEELARRRRVGSIQAIHESLYNVLGVGERALEPYTVALLWMSADDRYLTVKELRSHSDFVVERPVSSGEGFVGAIIKRKEPLVLTNLKPGHSGLVYYTGREPVTDFAGVPVCEGEHLRGVLLADRSDGRAFADDDVEVLKTLAAEIVRAVQVERIFGEMDREKYQKERFYQASQAFNSALTIEEVAGVAIDAARRIAQVEFAAMAVAYPGQQERLRIAAAEWEGGPDVANWLQHEFAPDESLVGAAIKARHSLPHGTARGATQRIFDADLKVELPGIKVFPLLWKDQGVGALVLGSEREDFLPFDRFEMVRVIADHAASAIANAQMFESVQRMATTDGLTGLINHRRFQELFDDSMARAERYGHRLSLILTDIDHFKTINDTYGHPVGDKVLKKVSALLSSTARRTDVVARYGGEEFAILMEQTNLSGALQIAERIRAAVEAEQFYSDHGSFKCSLSMGVASYPEDAADKGRLTEFADQALYRAKRGGRNRVVAYNQPTPRREVS